MGKRRFTPVVLKARLLKRSALRTGVLTTFLMLLGAGTAFAQCAEDIASVRGPFGTAQFSVTVADDNAERAQGLMFVESMPRMSGMVFVFDSPRRVSFWMRNTLIPLDMIFIGADGVVRHIHADAQPLDETAIFGGDDIQYVLEINGGMAARLGLGAGDEVRHPSFGGDAVWACNIN